MAFFAKLNSNNIVEQVIVINNNELLDNGIESEAKGIAFCKSLYGQDTNWKQTSYNTREGKHYLSDNSGLSNTQEKAFRKNYAGVGYEYNQQKDAFIPPKPFNSYILNESTCTWEPPIPCPEDGGHYCWNEENQSWFLVEYSV
jgi:hypothetical protein